MAEDVQARDEAVEVVDVTFDVSAPVIVDLGKQKRKRIKKLKKGKGRLWDEVAYVVDEVGASLGEEVEDRVLVPIIIVYEKKSKKGKGMFGR